MSTPLQVAIIGAGPYALSIAAHLRACGPCGEDFDGLLAALRDQAPEAP